MVNAFDVMENMGIVTRYIRVISYIVNNSTDDNIFYCTFEKLSKEFGISKPRISNFFRDLEEKGYIQLLQRGVYRLDRETFGLLRPYFLEKKEDLRSDHDRLTEEYVKLRSEKMANVA